MPRTPHQYGGYDFSQRVALITGASRGIGMAVAKALAKCGAHVVLLGRTQSALDTLYDDITQNGALQNATGVAMDITDFDAIDRLGASLYERFGKLDILIANAGQLGPLTPIGHIPPKKFDKLIAVNLTANARLIRAMEPLLLQSPSPRAIFLTSGAAYKARPFWGLYAASKAALDALVLTWANEHINDPLRINLLSPGPVRTDMRAQAMPGEDPKTLPAPEDIVPLFLKLCDTAYTNTAEIVSFKNR